MAGSHRFELGNHWTLKQSRVNSGERIEVIGPTMQQFEHQLKALGCYTESIQWRQRFFFAPDAAGMAGIGKMLETRPVISGTRVR